MPSIWEIAERRSHQIAVVPTVLGVLLGLLSGRTFLFEIAVIGFLGIISVFSVTETIHSVREELPRRRDEALVAFLQFGGYALAAMSLAALLALAFWTSHTTSWLVRLMFAGLIMSFSSGLVYMWIRPRRKCVLRPREH